MRDPTGIVVKDPNIEVQERLDLLFATFLKLGSVAKAMRLFNGRGLDLPRRDRHGDLRWAQATTAAVGTMLKNPAYAGAFVYGRTRLRAAQGENRQPVKVPKPIGEWRIIVIDRYPAYIDWQTYETIRGMMRDDAKWRGTPAGTQALRGCACRAPVPPRRSDSRLVAAELERRWEAALNEVRVAEEAVAAKARRRASRR